MPPSLRRLAQLLSLLCVSTLLLSCGGGGGSAGGGAGPAEPPEAPLSTGTFIDSPTKGLLYSASPSGLSGETDEQGWFDYRLGDVVTFRLSLGSTTVTLGEYMPTTADAKVSVLALRQGGRAAQLLQSLDHSAKMIDNLDVSGLVLDPADAAAIAAWFNSDGQILPPGKSAQQMLADAQMNALGSYGFYEPGAVSPVQALYHAASEAWNGALGSPSIDAATLVGNHLMLHTGFGNYGPVAELLWFDATTSTVHGFSMTTDGTGSATRTSAYTASSNSVELDDGRKEIYFHGTEAAGGTNFSDTTIGDSNTSMYGAGNFQVLPETPLDVVNRMFTVRGYAACGADADTTFAFYPGIRGYAWNAYCASATELLTASAPTVIEGGLAHIDPARPNLLQLANTCGATHVVAVLSGTLQQGRVAILTAGATASSVGRLDYGIVNDAALTPAALKHASITSCSDVDTPASTYYMGKTLNGTLKGPAGRGGVVGVRQFGGGSFAYTVHVPADGSPLSFSMHQLPEAGDYTIVPPPGCTVENGSGTMTAATDFTVDCSTLPSGTVVIEQGGTTTILGNHLTSPPVLKMSTDNQAFILRLPVLPDSAAVRVCAAKSYAGASIGNTIANLFCFASGTGMAMPYNPTPETGMPLYVRPYSTAHNYYSADRRVTVASGTSVYVNTVGFFDTTSGPFQVLVIADVNANGIVDAGELWRTNVGWPVPVFSGH